MGNKIKCKDGSKPLEIRKSQKNPIQPNDNKVKTETPTSSEPHDTAKPLKKLGPISFVRPETTPKVLFEKPEDAITTPKEAVDTKSKEGTTATRNVCPTIKYSSVAVKMMESMGWSGRGLGVDGDGIT